jgi:hypothetical protein
VQIKEFTLKESGDILRAVEIVRQLFMDADPIIHRSMQIRRDADKALHVYRHVYEDLKKEKTVQSLLKLFRKTIKMFSSV